MKKYISIFLTVAFAVLFLVQTDSFAKSEQQAAKRLSIAGDGEEYTKLPAPTVITKRSQDQAAAPRFGQKFNFIVDSVYKRVDDFWSKIILPLVDSSQKRYKYLLVVD